MQWGENVTTCSWKQTGLKPFNPDCEGWNVALGGVGLIKVLEEEHLKTESTISQLSYEVKVKQGKDRPSLTSAERCALRKGYEDDDLLLEG